MLETLISLVVGNPVVLAIVGGLVAVAAAFFKGRRSGRDKEKVNQHIREVKERKKNDTLIERARNAADTVDTDSVSDDGFRRD